MDTDKREKTNNSETTDKYREPLKIPEKMFFTAEHAEHAGKNSFLF